MASEIQMLCDTLCDRKLTLLKISQALFDLLYNLRKNILGSGKDSFFIFTFHVHNKQIQVMLMDYHIQNEHHNDQWLIQRVETRFQKTENNHRKTIKLHLIRNLPVSLSINAGELSRGAVVFDGSCDGCSLSPLQLLLGDTESGEKRTAILRSRFFPAS